MNKLLAFLLFAFSVNLYAGSVLDSEQTDFELESEACNSTSTILCSNQSTYGSNSEFYPVTAFGFYSTGPSWYVGNTGLKFNPVPVSNGNVSSSYAPAPVK